MSYWLETDCNMFIGYFASGAGFHDLQYFGSRMYVCSKNVRFFKVCPHVQTLSHILLFSIATYLDSDWVPTYLLGSVPCILNHAWRPVFLRSTPAIS